MNIQNYCYLLEKKAELMDKENGAAVLLKKSHEAVSVSTDREKASGKTPDDTK